MHANPDDLTALERQLAACRPSAAGLDTDAMLFAAGQAAAQRRGSRIVWPAIACGFAVLSAALGAGLMNERTERLALANRLNRPPTAVAETPASTVAPSPQPLSADSYFAMRRSAERNADTMFARADRRTAPLSAPPEAPIPRAWPAPLIDLKP
jgi:hypothetical protein